MYSAWIGSKAKDIDLEQFGYSRLGNRRAYAIYHLLFSPIGNPFHMDLKMVELRPDQCSFSSCRRRLSNWLGSIL